ncbi:hypothetical protein AKJ09_11419 [Labilithrix luteola]|uniref:BNR repeat domain protein n=2 Tax=Labilithrix luteola TaxID=1391654 RepID=A0A0K1QG67_9BACT|nr:hypothetical protein AKJ09_11419 [Labilithrix luteola]
MQCARVLVIAAMAGSAALALACSSSDDRAAFAQDDASSPTASLPEAAAPGDADSARDSGKDARAPFDPADEAVTCAGSPCVAQLAAGEHHVCARMSDGAVRCWGADDRGELGALPAGEPQADAGTPRAVGGLANVTQISAADSTTCARLEDGSIRCWGSNDHGQLALGDAGADDAAHPTPSVVSLPTPALRVDVGHGSVCALLGSGELWCWGSNEQAQLARGDAGGIEEPARAELHDAKTVRAAAGSNTAFALTSTGTLLSWGALSGDEGVVSGRVSSISPNPVPESILGLENVSGVSVSLSAPGVRPPGLPSWEPDPPPTAHACAIAKGDVFCWGRSERGALGTAMPDTVASTPKHAPILGEAYAQQVAAAGDTTCVRLTDGHVQCTGRTSSVSSVRATHVYSRMPSSRRPHSRDTRCRSRPPTAASACSSREAPSNAGAATAKVSSEMERATPMRIRSRRRSRSEVRAMSRGNAG